MPWACAGLDKLGAVCGVMVNVILAVVLPVELVAVIGTMYVPAKVGVPWMAALDRVSPGGKVPAVKEAGT